MVAMSGVLVLLLALTAFALARKKLQSWKWLQKLLVIAPIFPFVAIEAGWFTAELGRQPWVVYPAASSPDGVSLLTADAASTSVSAPELLITIVLFCAVYLLLFVAWIRITGKFIKAGPDAAAANPDEADVVSAIVDKIAGTSGSAPTAPHSASQGGLGPEGGDAR